MIIVDDMVDTRLDEETPEEFSEHVKYLDENTIDEFFLPHVKDSNGRLISIEQAAHDSPFENQENPGRIEDGVSLFRPDTWAETELIKGISIYQISTKDGTKSCYFTDQATIDACVDYDTGEMDLDRLKSMLQIYDTDRSKILVSKYLVTQEGIRAAIGVSYENSQYGIGGGTQYFIPHANEYKEMGALSSDDVKTGDKDA